MVPSTMTEDESASHESATSAVREFVVPASLQAARLDKAIAQLAPELSRARVKRAIELGAVRVNGRRMAKGAAVSEGDKVRIDVAQVVELPAIATPGAPLKVVFENAQVAVVDKPAGQATAPLRPAETGTLVNAVLGHYPELVPPNAEEFIGHSAREPGIIHRLDTETSGAVVVARTEAAFEALKGALKAGLLDKRYLLLCAAQGLADEGAIEFPLTNHPKDQRRVYACIHPRDVVRYEPRPACTRYRVVQRAGNWALVEVSVGKALRHQIPRPLRSDWPPPRRGRTLRRDGHSGARPPCPPRRTRRLHRGRRRGCVRRRGPVAQGHRCHSRGGRRGRRHGRVREHAGLSLRSPCGSPCARLAPTMRVVRTGCA